MSEIFLSAVIALVAMHASSSCIDTLYKKFSTELSFANEIERRSRFRKIILFTANFFCAMYLIKLPAPQNFYSIVAAIFLITFTITDFEQQIIFDKILLLFAMLGVIATIHLNLSLTNHLLAAIIGGGIFLLLAFITGGIGGGDIKLIASLGLWFGTDKLFSIVTIGIIFAGIIALILILFGKVKRKDYFAYSPYFTITSLYYLPC